MCSTVSATSQPKTFWAPLWQKIKGPHGGASGSFCELMSSSLRTGFSRVFVLFPHSLHLPWHCLRVLAGLPLNPYSYPTSRRPKDSQPQRTAAHSSSPKPSAMGPPIAMPCKAADSCVRKPGTCIQQRSEFRRSCFKPQEHLGHASGRHRDVPWSVAESPSRLVGTVRNISFSPGCPVPDFSHR